MVVLGEGGRWTKSGWDCRKVEADSGVGTAWSGMGVGAGSQMGGCWGPGCLGQG